MPPSRRHFLQSAAAAGVALGARAVLAQNAKAMKSIDTAVLSIGYEESGNPQGFPIILLHGFPDDARAWDDVAPPLAKAGYRVLVPYLRGYGPTKFRNADAPRMAEQAAIGQDVIDFADALKLPKFALSGYDWGGRAACIAAALHPDRVRAAALISGYLIQNVFATPRPAPPEAEKRVWYQYYFNTERGREGLKANRQAICKFLWHDWSPSWRFTDETYNRTAPSFENPDFVDVVIHSYRHRIGNAPGEPRFEETEHRLTQRPKIEAPVIVLHGADDILGRASNEVSPAEKAVFPSLVAKRIIADCGHFMPRERPEAVSTALLELLSRS